MPSRFQPWCLPFFVLLATTVACSSKAPPSEPQGSAASHFESGDDDDDGSSVPASGDDDDGTFVPATGDDGAGTSTGDATGDQAAAGTGSCICKVTSSYDNGAFYDSEKNCEDDVDGHPQGTYSFQASCDPDQSVVGYVHDSRMNACLSVEFFLSCSPTESG
jgi:hypothetical protein